jgi:hypothetical protein
MLRVHLCVPIVCSGNKTEEAGNLHGTHWRNTMNNQAQAQTIASIGHAYTTGDYSGLSDCQLLDAICRIETLGDKMPAAMLPEFEAEADKRNLRGDLGLIWQHTHADYKSTYSGFKSILVLRQAGTSLVPLSQLTEKEIAARLPSAQSKEAKRLAAKGGAL